MAQAAAELQLQYVVLTSVARDDMVDEGAGQFAATVAALRRRIQGVAVEVLVPDFNGRESLIDAVLEATPDVFGHNMETVRRLTPAGTWAGQVRPLAGGAGQRCPAYGCGTVGTAYTCEDRVDDWYG